MHRARTRALDATVASIPEPRTNRINAVCAGTVYSILTAVPRWFVRAEDI